MRCSHGFLRPSGARQPWSKNGRVLIEIVSNMGPLKNWPISLQVLPTITLVEFSSSDCLPYHEKTMLQPNWDGCKGWATPLMQRKASGCNAPNSIKGKLSQNSNTCWTRKINNALVGFTPALKTACQWLWEIFDNALFWTQQWMSSDSEMPVLSLLRKVREHLFFAQRRPATVLKDFWCFMCSKTIAYELWPDKRRQDRNTKKQKDWPLPVAVNVSVAHPQNTSTHKAFQDFARWNTGVGDQLLTWKTTFKFKPQLTLDNRLQVIYQNQQRTHLQAHASQHTTACNTPLPGLWG